MGATVQTIIYLMPDSSEGKSGNVSHAYVNKHIICLSLPK